MGANKIFMGSFRFTHTLGVVLIVSFIASVAVLVTYYIDRTQLNLNLKQLNFSTDVSASKISESSNVMKMKSPSNNTASTSTPTLQVKKSSTEEITSRPITISKAFFLEEACKDYIPRLPTVDMKVCKNSMMVPTGAFSVNGRPIIAREVPAAKDVKNPIRVLLIGGIHGDELSSAAIVFRWLKFLKSPSSRIIHWKIAPMMNPDGIFAETPTRMNANGIDLNRNFPMPDWINSVPTYWKKVTGSDPRRFPGKAPLSEPESRWIHEEILGFKPHVVISVHAPFGLLDFDGPTDPPHKFGGLYFNPLGVYPGSLGNYGLADRVPIVTIELPNGGLLPADEEVLEIWQDMLDWIKKNAVQKPKPIPTKSAFVQTGLKNNEVVATTLVE